MSITSFRSESAEIECRVCCTTLLQKNYKDNIRAKHPQEDHTDTTSFEQRKLSISFFKKVETTKKQSSGNDLPQSSDILSKTARKSLLHNDVETCKEMHCMH